MVIVVNEKVMLMVGLDETSKKLTTLTVYKNVVKQFVTVA